LILRGNKGPQGSEKAAILSTGSIGFWSHLLALTNVKMKSLQFENM